MAGARPRRNRDARRPRSPGTRGRGVGQQGNIPHGLLIPFRPSRTERAGSAGGACEHGTEEGFVRGSDTTRHDPNCGVAIRSPTPARPPEIGRCRAVLTIPRDETDDIGLLGLTNLVLRRRRSPVSVKGSAFSHASCEGNQTDKLKLITWKFLQSCDKSGE
ncbi:hypothetical protein NL676_023259 [Syzygium grande]|nr:hypothetical protein NL676_023259 [Syzygium grande]